MTLQEINSKYSWKELSSMPGNGDLRRELFTPHLKDLYENKIIYYERFACVAIVEDIEITREGFKATATPYLKIKEAGPAQYFPQKSWTFGSRWDHMRLLSDHFGTYCLWLIWTDKELVKTVEELARKKDFEAALNITVYKGL